MNNTNIPQSVQFGLPPYGGSGLKCLGRRTWGVVEMSPSIRREWIEMEIADRKVGGKKCLPPYGGSGLK